MKVINLLISSLSLTLLILFLSAPSVSGQQCGWQANNRECDRNLCCSRWGWCGSTEAHCGDGCQSNCNSGDHDFDDDEPTDGYLSDVIDRDMFEEFLLHRNHIACPGRGFYRYSRFIEAAKKYPTFGNTGDLETRKREIAAFFGQTSHETTGGWDGAPDGRFAWGYCFVREVGGELFPGGTFCDPPWPCNRSFAYYGRGPIQLTWNYNYFQCGRDIGVDLINNPDLIATDGVLTFETALWFWMTPQPPKPSSHDVITGQWTPSANDLARGRVPGYGVITNIINGGLECGFSGPDQRVESRIGFFRRYCDLYGIDPGENLDCYTQRPFTDGLRLQKPKLQAV